MDLGVRPAVWADPVTHGLDLDVLTEVSAQPATDLDDLLQSFELYRRHAVPSGAGMAITLVIDALPLVITAMDAGVDADRVVASMKVPLDGLLDAEPGSTIEFFATDADAFADFSPTLGLPLNRFVGGPRGMAGSRGQGNPEVRMTGLEAMVQANQAIGMLIGDGYTPEAARAELERCGRLPHVTMPAA